MHLSPKVGRYGLYMTNLNLRPKCAQLEELFFSDVTRLLVKI